MKFRRIYGFISKKTIEASPVSHLKKRFEIERLDHVGYWRNHRHRDFVVTGVASAVYAGPALILSFVLAAFVVILSGLSFAEFASVSLY